MTARQLVVVDVESSGLRDADLTVECAWRNLDTGDHGEFVPAHDCAWVLRFGHPTALEMNGYRERLLDAPQDDGTEVARLHAAIRAERDLIEHREYADWLRLLEIRGGLVGQQHLLSPAVADSLGGAA